MTTNLFYLSDKRGLITEGTHGLGMAITKRPGFIFSSADDFVNSILAIIGKPANEL